MRASASALLVLEGREEKPLYGKIVPAMAGWQFSHHQRPMDMEGGIPCFFSLP